MKTSNEIIQKLKSLSNPKNIEGMKRFACGGSKTLGISMPVLRKMAKDINREYYHKSLPQTSTNELNEKHKLAQELWDSGYHEARILASMIDEASLVTEKQMDSWIVDFDSWDVCDQVCMNLFAKLAKHSPPDLRRQKPTSVGEGRSPGERRGKKLPDPYKKAVEWTSLPHSAKAPRGEYQKRAGFALMAVLAWHDKTATDDQLKQFFPYIIKESTDDRNFVKKAVNWALRQIGKSRPSLRQPAIDTAKEILKVNTSHRGAKWIANDTIRELSNLK